MYHKYFSVTEPGRKVEHGYKITTNKHNIAFLHVEPGPISLHRAFDIYKELKKDRDNLGGIVLLPGDHNSRKQKNIGFNIPMEIDSDISITSDDPTNCTIFGGLIVQGVDCKLTNITVESSRFDGVHINEEGKLRMINVHINNSGGCGVLSEGFTTMMNCKITGSKFSGIKVKSASTLWLSGHKKSITKNCTLDNYTSFGLNVVERSTILLMSTIPEIDQGVAVNASFLKAINMVDVIPAAKMSDGNFNKRNIYVEEQSYIRAIDYKVLEEYETVD